MPQSFMFMCVCLSVPLCVCACLCVTGERRGCDWSKLAAGDSNESRLALTLGGLIAIISCTLQGNGP